MLLSNITPLPDKEYKDRKENIPTHLLSFFYPKNSHLINISLWMYVDFDLSLNFHIVPSINDTCNIEEIWHYLVNWLEPYIREMIFSWYTLSVFIYWCHHSILTLYLTLYVITRSRVLIPYLPLKKASSGHKKEWFLVSTTVVCPYPKSPPLSYLSYIHHNKWIMGYNIVVWFLMRCTIIVWDFYAPISWLLNTSFNGTKELCNIFNWFGVILRLSSMNSADMFDPLEFHGSVFVDFCFVNNPSISSKVGEHIITLYKKIVLD